MRDIFTISLIASTIRLATPLVLAALGGLFSERSGVINIALEGKMLAELSPRLPSLTRLKPNWEWARRVRGLACSPGMIAGLFIAVIYAVSCIKFKSDQVVSGAAINILMLGMPGLLSGAFLSFRQVDSTDS
jgi:simple sugar transport system permease protein